MYRVYIIHFLILYSQFNFMWVLVGPFYKASCMNNKTIRENNEFPVELGSASALYRLKFFFYRTVTLLPTRQAALIHKCEVPKSLQIVTHNPFLHHFLLWSLFWQRYSIQHSILWQFILTHSNTFTCVVTVIFLYN